MRAQQCIARGFSLVELLAGLAIGGVVVAAALSLLAAGAHEGRRAVAETRLTQDLRSAAEHVARSLRRAGHWGAAGSAVGNAAAANPYAAFTGGAGTTSFYYSRDAVENGSVDGNEQFAYRLRNGVVELQIGGGGWQAMTDTGTVRVTALAITPQTVETPLPALCVAACSAGSTTCPPRHQARWLNVDIAGHAPQAPATTRRFATDVQLRNGLVVGACED